MRIFTPDEELPFAGHPTIGTAFVLVSEGRISSPATQVVKAGEIPVEVDVESGTAWMTQLPPEFGPEFDDRELLARATGLSADDLHPELAAQTVSTGLPPLIVPIRDLEALRRASPDRLAVAEACERSGGDELYLFAVHDGGVTARFFGPTVAIVEDPATGSAAGPLGAYLAAHGLAGMPGEVTILQGAQVGRPSELHVEVAAAGDSWRIRVGGGVRIVGEGTFRL
jgi:trans-2,3-dihydro-3-hydroxyanthranilate isomerase